MAARLAKEGIARAENLALARKHIESAYALSAELVRKAPDFHHLASQLASGHFARAHLAEVVGDEGAVRAAQLAAVQVMLDFFERQARLEPQNPEWVEGIADRSWSKGLELARRQDDRGAREWFERSWQGYEALARLEPDDHHWLAKQAEMLDWIATVLRGQARKHPDGGRNSPEFAESLKVLRASVELREKHAGLEPANAQALRDLAEVYIELAGEL
jgi:hypothetical protein